MYFKASLVQFTTLCMFVRTQAASHLHYIYHTGTTASHGHHWQCMTHAHRGHPSVIINEILRIHWRTCASHCPHFIGTLNPIASSKSILECFQKAFCNG